MSEWLDAAIKRQMGSERISVAGLFGDDLLPHLEHQLEQLSRLTTALDLLYPKDWRQGESSIDRAIRILEERR